MIIQRLKSPNDRTNGLITLANGLEFKTLERPWLNNKVSVSCIPAGHYKFVRDLFGKFKYFKILNVPDRTSIEFHLGTKPIHSKGCILVSQECIDAMMILYGDLDLFYVLEVKNGMV